MLPRPRLVFSTEFVIILLALLIVAGMYSSIGLGGASGYLAVLSLSSFANDESMWLKQYAWSLNLIVAGLAFWQYRRSGHHVIGLSVPFVCASVPLAAAGGYLLVEGNLYDFLLSLTLLVAAWMLFSEKVEVEEFARPSVAKATLIGGAIGFASGVIGIGGGIFLLPALILGGWGTAKEAAATASLFVWLNSLSGLMGASLAGTLDLDLEVLVPFATVVLLGGLIGSRYGSQVSSQRGVRLILVLVLVLAASKRIFEIFS